VRRGQALQQLPVLRLRAVADVETALDDLHRPLKSEPCNLFRCTNLFRAKQA
jgi:hypothetical protein